MRDRDAYRDGSVENFLVRTEDTYALPAIRAMDGSACQRRIIYNLTLFLTRYMKLVYPVKGLRSSGYILPSMRFRDLVLGSNVFIPSRVDYRNAILRSQLAIITFIVAVGYVFIDIYHGIQGNEP